MRMKNYLLGLSWHTFLIKECDQYPYDRNPKSTAYIPYENGQNYYQGGLNDGRTTEYLMLIEFCCNSVLKDEELGIVARINDESHLNKYLFNKKIKTISTLYGKPEEWFFPAFPKIIFRDKEKVLGNKKISALKGFRGSKTFFLKRVFEDLYKYAKYKIRQMNK